MDLFSAHGHCELSLQDNVLVIDAYGPWNVEFINHLHQLLINNVRSKSITDFAVLLRPHGEALLVSQAIPLHVEFLKHSSAKAVAIDLSDCTTKSMTKDLCHLVYGQAGLRHQVFDDGESAQSWLVEQLAR